MEKCICEVCNKIIDDIYEARIEWGFTNMNSNNPFIHLCHNECSYGYDHIKSRVHYVRGDLIFGQNCLPTYNDIRNNLEGHKYISTEFEVLINNFLENLI